MIKAIDIMNKSVVTVSPDTTVEELGRLLIEKDISGAPVVDGQGGLFGIVTENDLISRNKRFHIPTVLRIFDAIIPLESSGKTEAEFKRMSAKFVRDICVREVKTIGPDTPLDEIATIMAEQKIHLLPVVESGKIIGIVGKHDIIKALSR